MMVSLSLVGRGAKPWTYRDLLLQRSLIHEPLCLIQRLRGAVKQSRDLAEQQSMDWHRAPKASEVQEPSIPNAEDCLG